MVCTITFYNSYSAFSRSESDCRCPFLRRNTWSRRAARYSRQIFDFSKTFVRPRVTFLAVYQLIYVLDIFRSVLTVHGHPLPTFRSIEFVLSILRRSFTDLAAHFVFENFSKYVLQLVFSWRTSSIAQFSSYVNDMFNAYQQTLRHDDVIVYRCRCVSCEFWLFSFMCYHLLNFVITICSKFTEVSRKWVNIRAHCTLYIYLRTGVW